jgi:hypothetical protein
LPHHVHMVLSLLEDMFFVVLYIVLTKLKWFVLRPAASTVEGRLKHHRHENREKRHSKKKRQVSECEGDGTQAASKKKEEKTRQLHEASREGNAARVAQLLSEGARITGKDDMGYTALHWASLYGHVQVMPLLSHHLHMKGL